MGSTRRRREPRRRPLTVLHTDERWVAVDKPAGIPVHGGAGKTGPSVLERLHAELGGQLHLAHRLDRATAGVLLLARSSADARHASSVWDRVEKQYLAVVAGQPEAPATFTRPLKDPDGRARDARTLLLDAHPLPELDAALCRLRIETGRLHQIRRHLAMAGHPVLMDDKHGDFGRNRGFAERVQGASLPKPKHLLLLCHQLRAPADSGLPELLRTTWPRGWPALLELGGLTDETRAQLAAD